MADSNDSNDEFYNAMRELASLASSERQSMQNELDRFCLMLALYTRPHCCVPKLDSNFLDEFEIDNQICENMAD